MQGLMQDVPLTLPHFVDRAERLFGDKQVVTVTAGGRERVTYADWAERTRRLGGVLDDLGIGEDGRVGTFAWNTARHLELYFAAPCTGRVLHTLNIRLFPDQLTYVAGIPPFRGGIAYEEMPCPRREGGSIRSSARARFGSFVRPASPSLRLPGSWGSTRARWATG